MKPQITLRLFLVTLFLSLTAISFGQAGYIYTVAGNSMPGYTGDGGPATAATLSPSSVTLDPWGNIYISDNHNIVRKIDAGTGVITTIAGIRDSSSFFGDGGPATLAHLNSPTDMVADAHHNLFICDWMHNRVRKIDSTGIITTVAGNDTGSSSADGIPATAAWLGGPFIGIALDNSGNLYLPSFGRIRKISPSGILSTVAGIFDTFGYSGDGGPATNALLNTPTGLAVDAAGNVYIGDQQNFRIRKVSPSGIITTIAGTGTMGFSGDGGPATAAKISTPHSFVFDPAGNLIFNDYQNHAFRKINSAGIITTIAGPGSPSSSCYSGEGVKADTSGICPGPEIAITTTGIIYFVNSTRVSKIIPASLAVNEQQATSNTVTVSPNPATNELTLKADAGIYNSYIISDCVGSTLLSKQLPITETTVDISNLSPGMYFVRLAGSEGPVVKQFIKM